MQTVAIIFVLLAVATIIAMFVRSKKRAGLPLVSDRERQQLRELRSDFSPNIIAGKILGTVGMLVTMGAFLNLEPDADSNSTKLSTTFFILIIGIGLIFVAVLLVKPRQPRPRYFYAAIWGIVCSACILLFAICTVYIARTPREQIPRWAWDATVFVVVVGLFSAIACITAGISAVFFDKSSEAVEAIPGNKFLKT